MLDKFNKLYNQIIKEESNYSSNSFLNIINGQRSNFSYEDASRLEKANFKPMDYIIDNYSFVENMQDVPDEQPNNIYIFRDVIRYGCQLATVLQSYGNEVILTRRDCYSLNDLKKDVIPKLEEYIQNEAMNDAKRVRERNQDDPNQNENLDEYIDDAIPYLKKALEAIKRL